MARSSPLPCANAAPKTASRRSASWSCTQPAGLSTATGGASTTSPAGSAAVTDGKRWIACRLEFRDWHQWPLLQPGRFTELFFLDEMTAFAAGHRPCALCRREDFVRFSAIWRELHPGQIGADAMDGQLHAERLEPERGRTESTTRRSMTSRTARSSSGAVSRTW